MPQALRSNILFVSFILFTGLIPALSWTLPEPLWTRKPSSLTSQNNPEATLERMRKHWNTMGLAASEIAIRYTIRNAESFSTKHYDMTYRTCKILFCIRFSSCILHVFFSRFKICICHIHNYTEYNQQWNVSQVRSMGSAIIFCDNIQYF